MLPKPCHFGKMNRKDEVCGFTCPDDLKVGKVFKAKLTEISIGISRIIFELIFKRHNRIRQRHEYGRNFHMNKRTFPIDNK